MCDSNVGQRAMIWINVVRKWEGRERMQQKEAEGPIRPRLETD